MVAVGLSFKPLPGWTVVVDGTLHGFVEYEALGRTVSKLTTLNGAVGTEVEVTPTLSLRAGGFTNFTSAKRGASPSDLRPDSWDQYGGTLGASFLQEHYCLNLAAKVAWMKGEASFPTLTGEAHTVGREGRESGGGRRGTYFY